MNSKHEIVIDLDHISDDPNVLAKLYECGNLMIQSDNRDEVHSGYQILEIVDHYMQLQRSNGEKS